MIMDIILLMNLTGKLPGMMLQIVEYTQYYIEGNTSYNYIGSDHLEENAPVQ